MLCQGMPLQSIYVQVASKQRVASCVRQTSLTTAHAASVKQIVRPYAGSRVAIKKKGKEL
jgi:hypothetical protein